LFIGGQRGNHGVGGGWMRLVSHRKV
jgi:hypothetical protein